MSQQHTAHVSKQKKQTVEELVKLIKEYGIVGVVDVENLPSLQLNRMRKQLRGTVKVLMTKKRFMKIALEKSKKDKPGVEKLTEDLRGMPAFIFTEESPFKLFKILKKNKSNAPIKAGQLAPNDIIVPAGGTGFAPGPVIGELGALGIKSGIENGTVAIKEDATVAKEGEEIKPALAAILTRLGIEPMEIGLSLTALYEKGSILTKEVLDIDEEAYIKDIQTVASWAFNLAVNASYPTRETIMPMLAKAGSEAFGLAVAQDIMTSETKEIILAKAEAQATALNEKIPQVSSPQTNEKKEEEKEEHTENNDAEESAQQSTDDSVQKAD